MRNRASRPVERARGILRGEAITPEDARELVGVLKKELQFGLARKVLRRVRKNKRLDRHAPLALWLCQQHALCTYKDPDLLRSKALEEALRILSELEDLSSTEVKETLGIAGAIWKRRYEVDNDKSHLERALHYYRRGYASTHAEDDYGYTGINAAFVLDLLAHIEVEAAGAASEEARRRRAEAREIRTRLAEVLPPKAESEAWLRERWWFLATLAEAHMGLGNYDEAGRWLGEACKLGEVLEWEKESTVRQLVRLASLRAGAAGAPEAAEAEWRAAMAPLQVVLSDQVGEQDARLAVQGLLLGKVGLALSGGGFRASFFHIGVLARLAEHDVLRHVEALSCVSGGSILGAHYYLELRDRLRRQERLGRQDYIDIVQKVAEDFLEGVQRNVRTRIVANWLDNVRMIFGHYSRTHRLGELFEKELYARVADGEGQRPRYISDLFVEPAGWKEEGGPFEPKRHNWRRLDKVPMLILNATTLNTGHNWQFTASWMGEPPETVDSAVDVNERLRRLYYRQAPGPYRRVRLGHAVAASACVPGLFEPLSLPGLYEGRTVELVDGGVHDNQGTSALLGEGCDLLLVSDASGQMSTEAEPKDSVVSVALRSNNILMKRVRTAQHDDLAARRASGLLRGLMFVHLKDDLDTDPVDWLRCQDPFDASDDARPAERRGILTAYGIERKVQGRIAEIRTDLDSFSRVEAFALMVSGYRMAAHGLEQGVGELPRKPLESVKWPFLELEAPMRSAEANREAHKHLLELLGVAKERMGKIWRLDARLRWGGYALAALAVVGFFWASLFSDLGAAPLVTLRSLGGIAAAIAIGAVAGKTAARIWNYRSTAWKAAVGLVLTVVGWLGAWLHLRVFDRWFLKRGEKP